MSVGFKPGVKEYGKGDIDDGSAESKGEDDMIGAGRDKSETERLG